MPAAAHREVEAGLAGVVDGRDGVGRRRGPDHEGGPPVVHAVVDAAVLVVAVVARLDDGPAHLVAQLGDGGHVPSRWSAGGADDPGRAFPERSRSVAASQSREGGERPVVQPRRVHRNGRLDRPAGAAHRSRPVARERAQLRVDAEELGEQVALSAVRGPVRGPRR